VASADDVNILSIRVHMAKKCTEGLAVVSKATGLAVNVDKTQYVVMSGDQTAGRSYNMKTDNSSFETVEQFRYLGTNLTSKILFTKKLEQTEVRECLKLFGVEFFIFQFSIQKFKD